MICSFDRLVLLRAALHAGFLIAREFTSKSSHLTTFKNKQKKGERERKREHRSFSFFLGVDLVVPFEIPAGQRKSASF